MDTISHASINGGYSWYTKFSTKYKCRRGPENSFHPPIFLWNKWSNVEVCSNLASLFFCEVNFSTPSPPGKGVAFGQCLPMLWLPDWSFPILHGMDQEALVRGWHCRDRMIFMATRHREMRDHYLRILILFCFTNIWDFFEIEISCHLVNHYFITDRLLNLLALTATYICQSLTKNSTFNCRIKRGSQILREKCGEGSFLSF